MLDGVEKVVDGVLRLAELLLVKRHIHVVAVLQIHQHGDDCLNRSIIHHHFHGFADDQIFDPVLFDGFLVTFRALFLNGNAFIVVMNNAGAAGAAFAAEVRATISAKQLRRQ